MDLVTMNMTNDSLVNDTNCKNERCLTDDEYLNEIIAYVMNWTEQWDQLVMIVLHVIVFVIGLVGNFLVCLAVYRNHTMRTVTNLFIVNLAIADFLVVLICLPPTVLWDFTETWFFGSTLCKIILYFQVDFFAIFGDFLNIFLPFLWIF